MQETARVRLLRGTESDILADGALDYPDAVLDRLDVVIASIHNRNQQDEDAMTRRIVQAMRHPVRKIWGHPLGRMLLRRPPVPLRMGEVLDAIAESDAIIELNGDPIRLDLPSEWARAARARGIHRFVVSVDAHQPRSSGTSTTPSCWRATPASVRPRCSTLPVDARSCARSRRRAAAATR
ncbi:MAG: hypothetical protein U1F43_07115 [Myxococcota bacterium]